MTRDAFVERLRTLILQRIHLSSGPVGLYAEREHPRRNGVPYRLFKEKKDNGRMRAYGMPPAPIAPIPAYSGEVGSEGIVANLITEICRENPKRAVSHPGPVKIRKSGIRVFMIISDFIGSGERLETYLSAAWRVKSVKSWHSMRARKGIRFEVVSFSATEPGRARVESHASRPEIHLVTSCPSIDSCFAGAMLAQVRRLCIDYAPAANGHPLGHGGVGALIAFAHGAPNNMPSIFHKGDKSWLPLFPGRVTSSTRETFDESMKQTTQGVQRMLIQMRERSLAAAIPTLKIPSGMIKQLVVLVALRSAPRTPEAVSRRTKLTLMEVSGELSLLATKGWITGRNVPTDKGKGQLQAIRGARPAPAHLPIVRDLYYYPKQLRAPR